MNIIFNILSLIFNIFSFTMTLPFLDILFLTDKADYSKIIAKGLPEFHFTFKYLEGYLTYHITLLMSTEGINYVLMLICVVFVIIILLKNLFRYLAVFAMAPIRNGVVKDIRNEIFEKVLELPLSYYSAERKGDIMARMTNDITEIEWSVMQSIELLTINPITIIVLIATLLFTSVHLTIIIFILFPITAFLIAKIGGSLRRSSTKAKSRMGSLFSMIEETLGGVRIIKAFSAEKLIRLKFFRENREYTRIMNKVYRKTDLASPLTETLVSIVLAIIMYLGGQLAAGNLHVLDGAQFIFYLVVFSQLVTPAKAFSTAYFNVEKGIASIERINKIMSGEVSIKEPINPKYARTFEQSIVFDNVSFSYFKGDSGYALMDINLTIPKGKTIAIVGQSGSGKSTLADMLPRFYDPTMGRITLDGIPIQEIGLTSLRSMFGIVTQETILFNDTIKNNIAFGMKDVPLEKVIEAAKVANAHDFIMRMEMGYETNIGDRGANVSGGERQRLSLARAIIKNPPILILDEATSALDTESERLVQDALSNLMSHRTSLVIAHRLSTIKNADEIIVMQKGRIVERGTHGALINTDGVYRKLYDLQSFV
jgi:subfamily B ATP-binding cassette protein MsbA